MKRIAALLILSLALPLVAAPQSPQPPQLQQAPQSPQAPPPAQAQGFDAYLPDQGAALFVVHVDKQAADLLTSLVPLDPALTKKVLEEHFTAFSQAAGINLLELASVFGGFSPNTAPAAPGVVGLQLPLELPKVSKMLKGLGPTGEVKETADQLTMTHGLNSVTFLKEGLVLFARSTQLEAILKRKGPAPTNADLAKTARARGSDTATFFLLANVPAGALPPLPDHPAIAKLNVDRQLSTHLTGVTVASDAVGLKVSFDFEDAASASKLLAAYSEGFKLWKTKVADDLATAEKKTANLGALGYFAPDIISAKMAAEMADYIAKSITAVADGKLTTITVPRELLHAFKGVGTIATLGVAAGVAVPMLKQLQGQGGLPLPGLVPGH